MYSWSQINSLTLRARIFAPWKMYWVSFIRLGTGMPERQVATVSVVTPIGVLRECSSAAQIGSSYVITGHCLIWCHVRGSGEYLSPEWCLFYSWKKAELCVCVCVSVSKRFSTLSDTQTPLVHIMYRLHLLHETSYSKRNVTNQELIYCL
jgi:hypothetical protein